MWLEGGKPMFWFRVSLLISLLILWLAAPQPVLAQGEAPISLSISHVRIHLPLFTVYFDLTNEDGTTVTDISDAGLSATIGTNEASTRSVTRFEDSGEGVAYIFLVDVSRSLREHEFAEMSEALSGWLDEISDSDYAAIISFGNEVVVAQPFTQDKDSLKAAVTRLAPTDDRTRLHGALARGIEFGRLVDETIPGRRIIVVLSDGVDDAPGGVTRTEVLDMLGEDRVPIYAVAYYRSPPTPALKAAIDDLGEIARRSGGSFVDAAGQSFEGIYDELRRRIRQIFVAIFECPTCTAEGTRQRLQVTYSVADRVLSDGVDLRLHSGLEGSEGPDEDNSRRGLPPFALPLMVFAAAASVLAAVILFRRRASFPATEPLPTSALSPLVTVAATEPVHAAGDSPAAPLGPGLELRLAVLGTTPPASFSVRVTAERAITLGRGNECEVTIDGDRRLSSRHCELRFETGALVLRDLGSANGTFVNGVAIDAPRLLNDDDVLTIGETELRVTFRGEEPG